MEKIMSVKFAITFSLVLFVLILSLSSISWSITTYVDNSNTSGPWDGTLEHPYQHIQDGIVHSATSDTVFVFNGLYFENLVIDSTIALLGENRDSTIIDGDSLGTVVSVYASNVTIRGFQVQNSGSYSDGSDGILLCYPATRCIIAGNVIIHCNSGREGALSILASSDNVIADNIISDNDSRGIFIAGMSTANSIYNNIITNNTLSGIKIETDASKNAIHDNTITANLYGIYFEQDCDSNTISGNTISSNSEAGVFLGTMCNGNIVFQNTITNNFEGVTLQDAHYNNISENLILHNSYTGVSLNDRFNVVSKNRIENSAYGVWLWGRYNHIYGNKITDCGWGFWFQGGNYNLLNGNDIRHNGRGIFLFIAISDTIIGNTIADNTSYGVYSTCQSIVFHHNSFLNNLPNACDGGSTDIWDDGYPSGGNYWSDYTGEDADSDGIGDTPYNIPGGNRQDRYPLVYLRGDVNRNLIRDIEDVIYLLNYVYKNGPAPNPQMAGDVNWDEVIDILDVYYLIDFLFASGPSPSF